MFPFIKYKSNVFAPPLLRITWVGVIDVLIFLYETLFHVHVFSYFASFTKTAEHSTSRPDTHTPKHPLKQGQKCQYVRGKTYKQCK